MRILQRVWVCVLHILRCSNSSMFGTGALQRAHNLAANALCTACVSILRCACSDADSDGWLTTLPDETTGLFGFIGGGFQNSVTGTFGVATGGYRARAFDNYASVAGGFKHDAFARFSSIAGGARNTARGRFSLAAGAFSCAPQTLRLV